MRCGAGRSVIEYGGYTWRTLDGADPQGPYDGAPSGGSSSLPPLRLFEGEDTPLEALRALSIT